MDSAGSAGGAGGSPGGNIQELQGLFNQFQQTLVQLRAVTTEGQQKIETSRARPQ